MFNGNVHLAKQTFANRIYENVKPEEIKSVCILNVWNMQWVMRGVNSIREIPMQEKSEQATLIHAAIYKGKIVLW